MFSEIVGQVFLAGMPCNVEISNFDLLSDPKEILFHRTGALFFNGIIGDGHCSAIVAVNWCGWLWVSEFGKTEAHDGGILAVVKESSEFGLGGGCHNKFANAGRDMEGSIELEWNAIAGKTAHEEDAAQSAPS